MKLDIWHITYNQREYSVNIIAYDFYLLTLYTEKNIHNTSVTLYFFYYFSRDILLNFPLDKILGSI